MQDRHPKRRALISVSDKKGILEFATSLHAWGVEILATGGSAELLKKGHIPVTDVSSYTEFPEIMEGRVKTLHPAIHAGILARRGIDDDVLQANHWQTIDFVVVNLYPFVATIQKENCTFHEAIEQIDIGGPTLLRAAAKNHAFVTVITDPEDYAVVLAEMQSPPHETTEKLRHLLSQKVFATTAAYDQSIATYLQEGTTSFPACYTPTFIRRENLRYGENPHQQAAYYTQPHREAGTLADAVLLQGKPLSYNNMIDADCALAMVQENQHQPYCVIVKHATPCGVAMEDTLSAAYQKAYQADPESAFGGILAFSQPLTATLATTLLQQQFVEVILVPAITPEAEAVMAQKPTIRLLHYQKASPQKNSAWSLHSISGGLLVQQPDHCKVHRTELKVVTTQKPTEKQWQDLLFAWHVVKFVKSNAIVFVNEGATLGIGGGQTSRIFAAKIAVWRANLNALSLTGSVMASDAFFPFADSIAFAKQNGIAAVIQPGGSKRDPEVIEAADNAKMVMVFTGTRHFRH